MCFFFSSFRLFPARLFTATTAFRTASRLALRPRRRRRWHSHDYLRQAFAFHHHQPPHAAKSTDRTPGTLPSAVSFALFAGSFGGVPGQTWVFPPCVHSMQTSPGRREGLRARKGACRLETTELEHGTQQGNSDDCCNEIITVR